MRTLMLFSDNLSRIIQEHPRATRIQIAFERVRFDFFSHVEKACLFARGRFIYS